MTKISLPGLSVDLIEGTCEWCGRSKVPTFSFQDEVSLLFKRSICEPCSLFLAWAWRRLPGDGSVEDVAASPFSREPRSVLVFIFRNRTIAIPREGDDTQFDHVPDLACPRDVLMVERKDEPGKFGLPGGKVEEGEDPGAAACRELHEETGVATWERALEPLHTGLSLRGRLVKTYLARGWSGEPQAMEKHADGSPLRVEWKPWPPTSHAGHMGAYYVGLEEAFDARVHLYEESGATVPLCGRLRKAGTAWVEIAIRGEAAGEDRELLSGYWLAMSSDERQTCDYIGRGMKEPKESEPAPAPASSGSEGDPSDVPDVTLDEEDGPTSDDDDHARGRSRITR